jgi:hypothetical protein
MHILIKDDNNDNNNQTVNQDKTTWQSGLLH